MVDDRYLENLKKLEELKNSAKKMDDIPLPPDAHPPVMQEPNDEQPPKKLVDDEIKEKNQWCPFLAISSSFLTNWKSVKDLTSLSIHEFDSLADECLPNTYLTKFDG